MDFDDGGFEERYFHLRTVLSDSGLEEIRLDYLRRPNGQQRLTACLKYTQLANCIGLNTLDGLNIRVTNLTRTFCALAQVALSMS